MKLRCVGSKWRTVVFVGLLVGAGAVCAGSVDDGWQAGRTQNSGAKKMGEKGAWNGFWSIPGFWEFDRRRLPNGWTPIRAAAQRRGLKLGIWYAPDSSNDAAMLVLELEEDGS